MVMVLFSCKACGGNIVPHENGITGKCEYCGTIQTLPRDKDEKASQILNRANSFRLNCDFDRAIFEYEKVLELNGTEPEAHWGLFLSKYGVEYVRDNISLTYKPTVHRISSVSVFDDVDYKAAIEYSSPVASAQYRKDAEDIEQIMKELLLISVNQEPYDIFLSYKELDDVTRQRTDDSYLAHDLYNELTAQGYKVFFAPKSLGVGLYEPKIYSAIISSKVMIVLGTKAEYLESVWVKNEWSRFAELVEKGEDKAIIPVFKNMDASQLPNRIAKYQAYDMTSITFLNCVSKFISQAVKVKSSINFEKNTSAEMALVERGFISLEDRHFNKADSFFENALNLNPHSSQAYFGKLMAEMEISKPEQILSSSCYLNKYDNFEKAVRFAEQKLKITLLDYEEKVKESIDTQIYNQQKDILRSIVSEDSLPTIINKIKGIEPFKDSTEIATELSDKYSILREIKTKCLNIKKEKENYESELDELRKKLNQAPEKSEYFRFIGVIVAVVLTIIVIFSAEDFDMVAMGIFGGIVFCGIGFVIGVVLDFTIGNILMRILDEKQKKSIFEEVKKVNENVEKCKHSLFTLNEEYDTIIKKLRNM